MKAISLFALGLLFAIGCATEPEADDALAGSSDELKTKSTFAADVDATLRAHNYQACDPSLPKTECFMDARTLTVIEIGEDHSPDMKPAFCLVSSGNVESCSTPISTWECHEGLCWCDGYFDCIFLLVAGVCDEGTYHPNPKDPGGSCYDHE